LRKEADLLIRDPHEIRIELAIQIRDPFRRTSPLLRSHRRQWSSGWRMSMILDGIVATSRL
jgi:hypothetical protein